MRILLGRTLTSALCTLAWGMCPAVFGALLGGYFPLLLAAQPPSTEASHKSQGGSAQAATSAPQTVIQSKVRQVLLDVVVTDGKNHPATGLQQEDFSIIEDGAPQKIVSFEAHSNLLQAPPPKFPELPALPPNTFLNRSASSSNSPLNVLLYDLLNTPIDDQPFAHKEILKFLRNRPAGSRFAIFVLADTLHLLQGFTDDDRQLIAAMNRNETEPHSSALYQSSGDLHDPSEQLSGGTVFANDPAAQAMVGRMKHMEALAGNYFLTRRADQTIAAFREIARFLSGLPGRKNLIWLSGSFPSSVFPGNDPVDPFGSTTTYIAALHEVADLLTVGQVAVYPVDTRGLTIDPVFEAAHFATYRTPEALNRAHLNFITQIALEQGTMDQIAKDTGGHAFYNTNGLASAIEMSTEDGANYYTLTYSPSNTKFDGRLRKIRIELVEKGYHLAYRRSYLADDTVAEENAASAAIIRLQVALRRGAPLAQELLIQAHITTQGHPKAATKEAVAQLAPFPAFASQKKWDAIKIQRYLIDYAIQESQISFASSASGDQRAKLEFLFGAYDDENQTMFGQRSPVERTISLKSPEEAQKGVYRMRQLLEIPSGAAWLRLAVRDAIGDRLGAIEIPLPLAPETTAKTRDSPH